jgi:hypothetical protein
MEEETPPTPSPFPPTSPSHPSFAAVMHNISMHDLSPTKGEVKEEEKEEKEKEKEKEEEKEEEKEAEKEGEKEKEIQKEYATPDGRQWYYRWIVLLISTISILLASIQQNALIVALPAVIDGLDASLDSMIWVLLAFSMLSIFFLSSFLFLSLSPLFPLSLPLPSAQNALIVA